MKEEEAVILLDVCTSMAALAGEHEENLIST